MDTHRAAKSIFPLPLRGRVIAVLLGTMAILSRAIVTAAEEPRAPVDLEKYLLDYPVTDKFCPPVRGTFYEVTQTMMMVNGKRFRQQPNGGYGLPVAMVVNGKHMLHLGADLGWHQVGAPVFAVANGVVRVSSGPEPVNEKQRADKSKSDGAPADDDKGAAGGEKMEWGNLVVIEHQTPEGEFFTTIYGHLATDRLVETGEVVEAGQPIGVIGRQHRRINGGYKPHLHFGAREGRLVETGAPLVEMRDADGNRASVTIAEIGEEETVIDVPSGAPDTFEIVTPTGKIAVTKRGEKYVVPSRIFWEYHRPDFPLVGYALTTDGWRDPIAFLKEFSADTFPAPFQPTPTGRGGRSRRTRDAKEGDARR